MPYMAYGSKNNTGPIEKSADKAVINFFKKYVDEDVCYVSEGEEAGNGIFIAKMRSQSSEIKREDYGL